MLLELFETGFVKIVLGRHDPECEWENDVKCKIHNEPASPAYYQPQGLLVEFVPIGAAVGEQSLGLVHHVPVAEPQQSDDNETVDHEHYYFAA